MSADRPTSFPWPPLLLLVALAGAWTLQHVRPIAWPGLDDWPARLVGIGFGIIGLVLITSAIRTLKRHNTTMMPHKQSDALVTDGPFQYFRNPIYLGDVFVFFGLADVSKNIWFVIAGIAFAVVVTWLAILPEEAHLEARFGDAYRDYKAKTKRWI